MKNIKVKGACVHNLKGFDIEIPKNKITVATGVSGSGKSSLMFDIIFEEGRKEYLQSLGMFAGLEDEQKFKSIDGISPTIAVKQSIVRQSNPRSTVGSRTQMLSMLALLYSSDGNICCSECGSIVGKDLVCPECGCEEEKFEVSYFSYNNSNGMCMECGGRGAHYEVNVDALMPDEKTTVRQVFRNAGITPGVERVIERNLKEYMDQPYKEIPEEIQNEVVNGRFNGNSSSHNQTFCLTRIFEGRQKKGEYVGGLYYMVECPECHGYRVGEEARRVLINGKHIGQVGKMSLSEVKEFMEDILKKVELSPIGKNLVNDILKKVNSLIDSRLGHLALYREMSTLSGGEIQRIFLNSHLESKMDSLIYILDEPSAGLHESEKAELLDSIRALKDLGNTVIVVEHDKNIIKMAEHIVDIGPKAGIAGGDVLYEGDYEGILKNERSLTGRYLSGREVMPKRTLKKEPLKDKKAPRLKVSHVKTNNLKDVTVELPLGVLVGVAGVSGSGKSSLVSDTIVPMLKSYFRESGKNMKELGDGEGLEDNTMVETVAEKLEGSENLSGFAEVSQAPIGRNINSSPVTFVKIWDRIRKLFAEQPEAIEQGMVAGDFSFNSTGACPDCGGSGRKAVFPGGMMKMYTTCETCKGKRYNEDALKVHYKGKNISEILDMQISEGVEHFKEQKPIYSMLKVMEDIGMGYIKLGQPTSTLSGGEAQRLKLAKEIGKQRKGNVLYIMDEPTTGLSMYDTAKLIKLLDELVKQGNSVILIEHNLDVLRACDYIVELGPEGGNNGGNIVAEGTAKELMENENSITGKYLKMEENKSK